MRKKVVHVRFWLPNCGVKSGGRERRNVMSMAIRVKWLNHDSKFICN